MASTYEEAVSIANNHIAHTGAIYVAAQVGGNVYVFAETDQPTDGADAAILLVGRTLADVSYANFA